MKRLFTSVLSFLMAFSLWAEAPQTISYQAVVRNNQGRLLRETNVGVRISIFQESENGMAVYTETRTVKTNVNGLMTFAIGDANGITSDTLSNIAWADNSYFLRCDIDLDGGENYTLSSTSQMNSVPYALYAKNIAPEALPTWAQSEDKPVYNYSEIQDAPEVPSKVSELENDANYITLEDVKQVVAPTKMSQMENDADYAKKSDIPSLEGYVSTEYASIAFQPKGNYITEAEASSTYQPKGNYLTKHQSLADYAKKSELPSTEGLLSEAKAAETYQPKGSYLTEHQSLAGYATKSELPKSDSLLSKAEASTTYQPKGNYLTEHQSLAGYVTKAEASTTYQPKGDYLTEHQSLAGYASKSDLPKKDSLLSKAEASTTYQPKGNYLTEHQSLADYAKKSELPSTDGLLSETKAAATYQPKGDYLTEHQSLAGYASKSDLPKKDSLLSKAEASTSYQPKGNYLTEHQSLADYAKKSDLPKKDSLLSKAEASTTYQPKGNYLTEHQSLAGYVTKAEASTTYQPKGSYLTEHQSLAGYAKKSDIPTVPTKVSSFTNDAGYLTEHQSLADYAKKSDIPTVPTKVSDLTNDAGYITAADIPTVQVPSLTDYAKKSELPKKDSLLSKAEASTTYQPKGNYLTEHQSLADYAKKTDIPTVPTKVSDFTNDAGYITAADIPTVQVPSLTDYAKKSDLPKKDSLLSKTEASETYQPKGNYLTEHQSLAGYVTRAEASTTYQPKGNYLTEHQSLADYAKKSELPKADSLLSKAEASTTYQPKGNYLTEHQSLAAYAKKSELPSVPTNVSSFTNDAGYLTEHQSLAAYAKKSELPSVPTNVSSFTNDAGYLTEHQSLAAYAKKSELPKADSLLSKAEASTTYQPKGNYLTEHQSLEAYAKKTDIPTIPTKVSSFTNDAGYLTEHQSLTDYAKKSDIPTVPTKVSSFTNDAGYLTEHQSLVDYAKKADIPTVPTKVSAFENDATYIKKADFDAIIADYSALLNKYKTELDSLKNVMSNAASGGVIRTVAIDNGALPGEFSVSATKKVKFSMGNLQYQASTKTWRFAANQYDYVGTPNTNISANYDGWIDLFGWGTSGWNSGATSYLPYSTNTVDGAYCPSKSLSINLVDNYSNADWGYYNAISNGGNEKGLWRTLTKDEWTYLFSGRPNAEQLKKSVTIDGVKGYVFFPDNWVEPEGISISSMSEFSIAKWNILESLGAVFLPAAGKRNETTISFVNTSAVYWSSTSGYGFDIEKSSISSFSRYYGYSVRLVKLQPQTISVNIEPSEGGYVDGVGSYEKGSVINLTAIPESGYFFKEWSDGVKSPNRKVTLNSNITLSAIYVKTEGIKEKGIIPGHFSVSANKTVYFSRGNLQYQASTDTWRFAEHQYDRIGADNKNISETYDGWIDLFGWGTSGFYDANISFPNKNHYPYSSSTKTYSNSFNYYEYGPPTSKVDKNLTGTSANYDWGVYNAISNGGNQKGQWRVLTADEWTYLYSGRKNAANLRTRATVEGVEGYIFLPDNWVNPDGISLSLNQNLFTINSYTSSEWNILEAYNAVFLPAAGSRSGTTVNNVGTKGYYWSSTYYEFRYSNYFNFDGLQRIERYCGLSVRLVQEVK